MTDFLNTAPIPRRTMVLFFIIDTSRSMYGEKIGAVNTAIREVIPEIKEISAENADALIKIAVLTFSSGAKWLYDSPIDSEQFVWTNLDADGVTDMGLAFRMLNEKLSRSQFLNDVVGSFAPALFLMSDGQPTDDYKRGIDELKKNNWFKVALKVAVGIGEDRDLNVLQEFTSNKESVITVHTPEALRKMIRFASVTASQIGSKSSTIGSTDSVTNDSFTQQKQQDFANQLQDFAADNASLLDDTLDGW